MTDFKIVANQLEMVDGDLILHKSNAELVQQRVNIALNLFKGEWWLDLSAGVPYLQTIFKSRYSSGVADAIIKDAILEVEGIQEVTQYSSDFTPEIGKMVVSFSAKTTDGEIFSIQNKEL